MATQIICDGCRKPAEESTQCGVVVKRDYCPTCMLLVQTYLMARDELHDNVAKTWRTKLDKLKKVAKQDVLELPDD